MGYNKIINNTRNNKKRVIIIALLICGCIIITFLFRIRFGTGVMFGIGRVYTHLFYIPIILACYWYDKRGLLVPFVLASFLLLSHLLNNEGETFVFDLLRGSMLIMIGIFTAFLSKSLNKSKRELIKNRNELIGSYQKLKQNNTKLQQSYKQLKEKEKKIQEQSKKLKEAKKELEQRVDELEEFQRAAIGREERIKELREEIEKMKK